MKGLLFLALLACSSLICSKSVHAQNTPTKVWDKIYGGGDDDNLVSFKKTSDGGYILAGNSLSGVSGDKSDPYNGFYFYNNFDIWVIKLDASGNKQWNKTFGGTLSDAVSKIIQTPDKGYIIGATSFSGVSGNKTLPSKGNSDYWLIKLDSLGNKQWEKVFGTSSDDRLTDIQLTETGGYFVGGNTNSGINGDKTQASKGGNDYWVLKLDASGNKIWDKTFGGSLQEYLTSIAATENGGCILSGLSVSNISGNKTEPSRGSSDYWIVKLNVNGELIWDKTYGGSDLDHPINIVPYAGGYFVGGYSSSPISGDKTQPVNGYETDFWVLRLDASGNKVWDKTIGGSKSDYLTVLQSNTNGGCILGGYSESGISGDKTEENRGFGDNDYWVVSLDVSGNKIWDKTIGGSQNDLLYGISQTENKDYILAGSSFGFPTHDKTTPIKGAYDYWLVKLNPSCLDLNSLLSVSCNNSGTLVTAYIVGIQTTNNTQSWTLNYTLNGVNQSVTGSSDSFILSSNANPGDVYSLVSITSGSCSKTLNRSYTIQVIPNAPTVSLAERCGVGPLTLTASGATIGGSYVWYSTPTGGTALLSDISGSFTTPSLSVTTTFYVAMTNNSGCEGPRTPVTATIKNLPIVTTGSGINVCATDAPFQLTGFYPSGGTWSGPGVNASGIFTPSTSLAGNQTLTYSVIQNGCTVSANQIIAVSIPPVVSAGTNQSVCVNAAPFQLMGFSPAGGIWSGSGVSSTGLFTPSSNLVGIQTLTYTYTENSCTVISTKTVTVNALPVVSAGINESVCSNASPMQLTGFSPSGGTWTGPGVTAGGLFTPSNNLIGSQILTYIVTQNGCTSSATKTISVNGAPTVTAGLPLTICSTAQPLQLSGFTPSGGTWSGNGVSASGLFTPSNNLIGNQALIYSVTQNGCMNSDTLLITVTAAPVVTAGLNDTVCADASPFQMTGATPVGGAWTGSGVSATGLFTPSTSLVGNQTLTYSYTQNGCTITSTKMVVVKALPNVVAGQNQTICEDSAPVQLTGFSPARGSWSGAGISATGLFTPSSSLIGNQTLTYTVTQNGCTASATKVITIPTPLTQPVISLHSSDTLIASTPGSSYEWKHNNNVIPGNKQKLKVTASGTYSVRVKDANNCASLFSADYTYTVSGLKEELQNSFSLYPNPSSGLINLELNDNKEAYVSIYNALGQCVFTKNVVKTAKTDIQIDLSKEAKGVYTIRVLSGTQIVTKKVVLQ